MKVENRCMYECMHVTCFQFQMFPVSEPHHLTCPIVLEWMWQPKIVIKSIVTSHVLAQAFIMVFLGSLLVLMVGC
jgi:hypothetical protein